MAPSDLSPEDLTVHHYMKWMESEWRQSQGKRDLDLTEGIRQDPRFLALQKKTNRQNATLCWTQLRGARLFHVGSALVKQCYMRVHRFLTEEVTGYNYEDFWYEPEGGDGFDDESMIDPEGLDYKHLIDTWRAASTHAPWPEKFPFDAMVLGYGEGYDLNDLDVSGKWPAFIASGMMDQFVSIRVVAHLITKSGYVWELACCTMPDGTNAYSCEPFRMPEWTFGDVSLNHNVAAEIDMEVQTGRRTTENVNAPGWRRTFDTTQWIVPSLMHVINQYRTLAIEEPLSPGLRRDWRHNRKQMGLRNRKGPSHPPPPVYHLKLKTKVIIETVPSFLDGAIPRMLRHRHDVRGHERCRIRRGLAPVSDRLREKLLAMEYTVYPDGSQIKDEDVKRLILRNRPLRRPGEWLAIKTTWIRPHVRGDESLPYVPALRIATGD